MTKIFSNRTPQILMQLANQVRTDENRREANDRQERITSLGNSLLESGDTSSAGLIKFATDNDVAVDEMAILTDYVTEFKDIEQKTTDRQRKLDREGVTQGRQDLLFGQGQQDRALNLARNQVVQPQQDLQTGANLENTLARTNRINNPVFAPRAGSQPKVPAWVGKADSIIKTGLNFNDLGGFTGENQEVYRDVLKRTDDIMKTIPPGERDSKVIEVTDQAFKEVQGGRDADSAISKIPKANRGRFLNNNDVTKQRALEAVNAGSTEEEVFARLVEVGWTDAEAQDMLGTSNDPNDPLGLGL